MTLRDFKTNLRLHPAAQLRITLPDGTMVPRHFHVTEVGHVAKHFVDCGGTFRTSASCVLQVWTAAAQDDGHRLAAGKLSHILNLAVTLLPSEDLPVELEFEAGRVSQFPVEAITGDAAELNLRLGEKHTDCLAREKCGAEGGGDDAPAESACCGAGEKCC